VEDVTRNDYFNEDMKANIKEFEKKLGEHLDKSNNFILQGEDNVNLKMLEDLDDEGIDTMMEDGFTTTKEEYDGMIVEECPEADDEEALDKYLNMELRKLLDEIMDHKKDDTAINIANGTVTMSSGNVNVMEG
jgi:hypothetical protein